MASPGPVHDNLNRSPSQNTCFCTDGNNAAWCVWGKHADMPVCLQSQGLAAVQCAILQRRAAPSRAVGPPSPSAAPGPAAGPAPAWLGMGPAAGAEEDAMEDMPDDHWADVEYCGYLIFIFNIILMIIFRFSARSRSGGVGWFGSGSSSSSATS